MSCFHPKSMYWTGNYNEKTGKKDYIFLDRVFYNHDFIDVFPVEHIPKKMLSSINFENSDAFCYREYCGKPTLCLKECVVIPCGMCTGCKIDKAKDWSARIVLEASLYKHNYFVTLTYDNVHLPKDNKLHKEHLSNFVKRLRRYYDYHFGMKDIRFFACGEHGDLSDRVHFHIILLNCPIDDLKVLASNGINTTYTSMTIRKLWPYGNHFIGEVTPDSCKYVAQYSLKKLGSKRDDEFLLMSRKPGIGKPYFDLNFEKIYKFDIVSYKNHDSFIRNKPPHYFDTLYSQMCPEEFEKIKNHRKAVAMLSLSTEKILTGMNEMNLRKRDEIRSCYKLNSKFKTMI